MSLLNSLGLGAPRLASRFGTDVERVLVQRPLSRILSFIGRSIDDVVNDPMVKGQVYGYFKLEKDVRRGIEVIEMERAWNKVGMRF